MRRIAVTLLLCSLFPSSGQTAEKQAVPIFEGQSLPMPPKQNLAWAAPEAKLTKNLLSATKLLFDQSVADPRGCEYHSIKIAVGNVWSDGRVVETHGWVFGGRGKDSQKFAVCWNGLVYPVVSVGSKIDVPADITAMLDVERRRRREFAKKYPDGSLKHTIRLWHEDGSTSHKTWLPIKASLLLRIGQVDLAEKYWQMWTERVDENTNNNQRHLDDPYLVLAIDWSWALFDRAVCAHMRGDDRLTLLSGQQLQSIQKSLQATAAKRGFTTTVNGGIDSPLFGFLEPLSLLLGDQRRRAKQPPYRTALSNADSTNSKQKTTASRRSFVTWKLWLPDSGDNRAASGWARIRSSRH